MRDHLGNRRGRSRRFSSAPTAKAIVAAALRRAFVRGRKPKSGLRGHANRCWQMCLLVIACTPANKVAEEQVWDGTGAIGSTDSDHETDSYIYGDCHAGGGEQPCSAVMACEAGCGTNTICLGDCRFSLCIAHEAIYCEMVDCITTYCEAVCEDLAAPDCLLCVSINCATSTAACSAAGTCEDENQQTD